MRQIYETLLGDDIVEVVEPDKKGPGRPKAFTEQKQQDYLERIEQGDGLDLAARNVKVSPQTVRAHRREFPGFEEQIRVAESVANGILESAAMRIATEGDRVMLIFLLQNRMPEKYEDRRGARMLQQINAGSTVELSISEARAEAYAALDELKAKRLENAAKAAGVDVAELEAAIDVASEER